MRACHSIVLRTIFCHLLETLDVEYGLLDILNQKGVLSNEEHQSIKEFGTSFHKSEKLILLLIKRPKKHYERFLEALCNNNQKHVVTKLEEIWAQQDLLGINHRNIETAEMVDKPDGLLHERFLRCHQSILNKLDSCDVRPHLFEHEIISSVDYETILCDNREEDRRGLCESLMYCIFYQADPVKLELKLSYFRQALLSVKNDRYLDLVAEIDGVNLDDTFGYMKEPCTVNCLPMDTGVRGVALAGGFVCIVLHQRDVICLYKQGTLDHNHEHCLNVAGLSWPSDMVAIDSILYISERFGDVNGPGIFSVNVMTKQSSFQHFNGDTPAGLSVTDSKDLLVSFEHHHRDGRSLRIFSTANGELTLLKRLDFNQLDRYLLQAAQVPAARGSGSLFAISQLRKKSNLHRICMVDEDGNETARAFGGTKKSSWPSVRSPWAVLVDMNERLLVANCHEHKIMVLDRRLNFCRNLYSQSQEQEFLCPRCMCFDQQTGYLYVGRRWKGIQGNAHSAVQGALNVIKIIEV